MCTRSDDKPIASLADVNVRTGSLKSSSRGVEWAQRWKRVSSDPDTKSIHGAAQLLTNVIHTAIPSFVLEAPYQVKPDPSYPGHLRVTLASAAVVRSFIDAWRTQTVAGYTRMKISEMVPASGSERVGNNVNRNGDGRPGDYRPARHSEPSRR
ncbi:hypothetical protein B0H13DRAFT_2325949 [Mycena leptocephala]|nr:hypothetical protein B0H13DRAFT_2325949 [Mycena leptocephala]